MSTVYQPDDTFAADLIHALATIVQNQVGGVGRIYEDPPEGPPEDNSVLFPYQIAAENSTTGKLRLKFRFDITHVFRRVRFNDAYHRAQSYVLPWVMTLSSWTNQSLGGRTLGIFPGEVHVRQIMTEQMPYVAVISRVEVFKEINIPVV